MTLLCWSSNLLIQTRLMRLNKEAGQGHFKKDNSACQNMLDLDSLFNTLKAVLADITCLYFLCHELQRLRCHWRKRVSRFSPLITTNAVTCRPHSVILWRAVRAQKCNAAPRTCICLCRLSRPPVPSSIPPLAPVPSLGRHCSGRKLTSSSPAHTESLCSHLYQGSPSFWLQIWLGNIPALQQVKTAG